MKPIPSTKEDIISYIKEGIFQHKDIENFCIKCVETLPFDIIGDYSDVEECDADMLNHLEHIKSAMYYFELLFDSLGKMLYDPINDTKLIDSYKAAIVLHDVFSKNPAGDFEEPIFHIMDACRHIKTYREYIGNEKDEEAYYFNTINEAILYHHVDDILKPREVNPFNMILHFADLLSFTQGDCKLNG